MNTDVGLCDYCHQIEKRPGSLFCCEGCQFLNSLQANEFSRSTKSRAQDLHSRSQETQLLVENYGNRTSLSTSFHCEVDALACEACLQALARLEQYIPSLQDLRWNRNLSRLSFHFAKGEEDPFRAFHYLKGLNLNPKWVRREDQNPAQDSRRARLLRLGITGALAGNIMMFAFSVYFGVSGEWKNLFESLQALIFLPVLLWSAQPIFKTAWVSTRLKQLSVDLPLALAFLAGSLLSYWSWWAGSGALYFDSLSGFLFLILLSRTLLDESLAAQLRRPHLSAFFDPPFYEVETSPGTWAYRDLQEIQPGETFKLKPGQRVPVEALLSSSAAEFDTSWLDGEAIPRLRYKDARVPAGAKLLSQDSLLVAEGKAEESTFALLLKELSRSGEKIGTSREAKIGTVLVLICFVLAIGLLLMGPTIGYRVAVERILALLIVACPCAVSFAAPLARARASFLSRSLGFWVRDPGVFERMRAPLRIAFDKTGTLTEGVLALSPDSPIVDDHLKRVILSLENVSQHPIAESFRKIWGGRELLEVTEAKEIVGVGVSGHIQGSDYQLKRGMDRDGRAHLDLIRNGNLVLQLSLIDAPKESIREALVGLKGHDLFILSGDAPPRVHDLAIKVGIPVAQAWGGLTPEGKLETLERIKPDLYIGDGANDLLALKRAPVSISTPIAATEAKAAADVLMLGADIQNLKDFLLIASETHHVVRRNFTLALIYNFGAGLAAILGLINPFFAALLMPASSLVLAGSTLWGSRRLRLLARRS